MSFVCLLAPLITSKIMAIGINFLQINMLVLVRQYQATLDSSCTLFSQGTIKVQRKHNPLISRESTRKMAADTPARRSPGPASLPGWYGLLIRLDQRQSRKPDDRYTVTGKIITTGQPVDWQRPSTEHAENPEHLQYHYLEYLPTCPVHSISDFGY